MYIFGKCFNFYKIGLTKIEFCRYNQILEISGEFFTVPLQYANVMLLLMEMCLFGF